MNWIIYSLLVLFAIGGGVWGWWKGTRDLRRPPDRFDQPIGISSREFARSLAHRYRRRRILLAVGGTVAGALGGFILLLLASMRRWSR